ncbi:MAG: penicillin-binding transpeptidase domain-containing protein [Methylococcales bacterium]|nr:penicillin-binding transpeptidase domain-containing protein [Methylococcales bacterium]
MKYRRYKNEATLLSHDYSKRRRVVLGVILLGMTTLVYKAVDLQVFNKDFLQKEGDMRHVSEVPVSAYRGMIRDRNGAPLAISTPVESIWINPQEFKVTATRGQIKQLNRLLSLEDGKIEEYLTDPHKQFAYLARQISPNLAEQVKNLKLTGVYSEREFKRFYPTGGVAAHLIGFTDLDDKGQEGLEAAYDHLLRGVSGSKRVIRDGKRQIIDDVENIKEPIAGKTLELSIDQRIQYLAYRELAHAVSVNHAKSASLVVLDAKNGEILAAVNQPAFNPNSRKNLKENLYRNRALTDVFEPGSTVKPFVVAAALDGKYVRPDEMFETNGSFEIGTHVVKDVHNYGTLDLTGVIKKSSNIAVSQMALRMPPKYFWEVYRQLGFGESTASGFPTEASGNLLDYEQWKPFDRATLSFGYGLNVTALQLARSYTALADNGILHSVSLFKRDEDPESKRIFTTRTAKSVRAMMETVIQKDGTAYEARVDGYSVAGKTGTVKKAGAGGYVENSYFSVFAGMAPASNPRLIITVMIDEPSAGQYYGGIVSAPVFSKVMSGALRILEVAPDQSDNMPVLLMGKN